MNPSILSQLKSTRKLAPPTSCSSDFEGLTTPSAARQQCPVCEMYLPMGELASHGTAHASKITDNLFLGAERNAHNLKELTVRRNVKRILNVAWEVRCAVDGACVGGGVGGAVSSRALARANQ